jgi:hypothetical protein
MNVSPGSLYMMFYGRLASELDLLYIWDFVRTYIIAICISGMGNEVAVTLDNYWAWLP